MGESDAAAVYDEYGLLATEMGALELYHGDDDGDGGRGRVERWDGERRLEW